MNNEEVKEEVKKVPEEVERNKTKFVNAQKLRCNYKTYKEERTQLNMPIVEKCKKCGKNFKDNDELYTAQKEKDRTEKQYIICKKCTK